MLTQPAPGTNEVAVMLDTRDALEVADGAAAIEWGAYVDSWKGGGA
jgi:homogentisate 1,2-dioxygenase